MKQKIKQFISSPKHAVIITLIFAITAGGLFSYIQNKNRAEIFSKDIPTTQTETITNNQRNLTLAFLASGRIKNVNVKIGDTVKTGEVLASLDSQNALGAVNQAKGAYTAAQNNYEKLLNGTSDTDVKIAKVTLTNAKNNYSNIVLQQKTLVANALSNLHNAGITALPTASNVNVTSSPIISGTYNSDEEGSYTITVNPVQDGYYFTYTGLETGTGKSNTLAVPLGTRGLLIQFPFNFISNSNNVWVISIPNTQSPSYLANYNAYQTALQNQSQAVAAAQGLVDSAQANLDQKVAGTRTEDLKIAEAQVESTQGALQIAEGNYNNTIITAPFDGTITNVSIAEGQIASPNVPAIGLLAK